MHRAAPTRTAASLLLVATTAVAFSQFASPGLAQTTKKNNRPPVISVSLAPDSTFVAGEVPWVKVTVTDPDGDLVYARLRGELQTDAFQPIVGEPSGTTHEFALYTAALYGGRNVLEVEAWDSALPDRKVTRKVPFNVRSTLRTRHAAAVDFDGDGIPEIVLRARLADVNGKIDCGAFVVWAPGRPDLPQPLVLHAANPGGGTMLGDDGEAQMQFADLDGDGRPELIGWSHNSYGSLEGLVSIWNVAAHLGQSQTYVPADATLTGNDPNAGVTGLGVVIRDFDHDGFLDVLTSYPFADTPTVDAGELCFYLGGPGRLVGKVSPTATLRDPNAGAGDQLGAQRVLTAPSAIGSLVVADVTGDGFDDVVVAAPLADRPSGADVGKILVFDGSKRWNGVTSPLATLTASTANHDANLGSVDNSTGLFVHDVTGDGVADVLAVAYEPGAGGSVYLWKGGSSLTGSLDFTARLRQLKYNKGDQVGRAAPGVGVLFDDFDGDGIDDVFAAAPQADVSTSYQAGMVYWFRGSKSLANTTNETASFKLAKPKTNDQLGSGVYGMRFADVTGDGVLDLLASSATIDTTAIDAGGIAVFAGKSGASGATAPSAFLTDPSPTASERLVALDDPQSSSIFDQGGFACEDVTGDGVRDVVAVAPFATRPGSQFGTGVALVFAGGAGLTGGTTPAPRATLLQPNLTTSVDRGRSTLDSTPIHLADLDGDGVRDVALYGADNAAPYARTIYRWRGGATLTGKPGPDAQCSSQKTGDSFAVDGHQWVCLDTDGDLVADVLGNAPTYNFPGTQQLEGAIYRFRGGVSMVSVPVPDVFVEPFDVGEQGVGFDDYFLPPVDLNGDGLDDLIVVEPWFESEFHDGPQDVGAVRIFPISGFGSSRLLYTSRLIGAGCAIGS